MAITKYRPAKRQGDEPYDRILASFTSKEAENLLTEHEKKVKERYVSVLALAEEHYTDAAIIKAHMEATGVSRATAYRDYTEAQELFSSVTKVTRQARRYAVLQLAKRGLQLAAAEGAAKAFASQVRNLIMLEGLDKDDTTGLDPEQMQPPTFVLQIQTPTGPFSFDVSKMSGIKDIPYQEIMSAVQSQSLNEEQMKAYLEESEQEQE
jgi:hypothetical protein